MNLAEKFCPSFIFAKDESYFPCSIEFLLANSDLRNSKEILRVSPTIDDLLKYNSKDTFLDIKNLEGDILNLQNNPVYYHILPLSQKEKKETLIQYYLMYPFNAPKFVSNLNVCLGDNIAERFDKTPNCLKCMYAGDHKYDLEHVDVLLDENNELKSVYFGAHRESDGVWKNKKDISFFEETHPVAYVASGGHGFYPWEGTTYRIFCCANDTTSNGYMLNSKKLVNLEDEKWNTEFVGTFETLGAGDTPKNHTYYNYKIEKSTNFFKRVFLPCIN